MQYEMDCLVELMDTVEPLQHFGRTEVQQLKAWVKEQGVTNLGMELVPDASAVTAAE